MRPEILAPAGSMEALKAAVHAGADAVYLGGAQFGARAYANNFDREALIEAIEYSHLYGVKVYLTINTLFRNEEIEQLVEYLTPCYRAGLDAVIVQDLGVMRYVHTYFPDLPIHASTQMTITTAYAYELIKEYGVTRIVPARELSMNEITALKAGEIKPEVEVFVQGALCYCYSGQCLMSSMLGGRSGNRGRCAQTCRLPYTLENDEGKTLKTNGNYLLSPKDLCGLDSIPELIQAGVDSFKIEGRMKKPEYVAACVRAYRNVLDAWYEGTYSEELLETYKNEMAEVFNRGGFTSGYYHQNNGKQMMSVQQPGNVGVTIGKIVSINKNQITIQLTRDVSKGDLFVPQGMKESITLTNNIDSSKGKTIVLNAPKTQMLYKGQRINRMSKASLVKLLETYISEQPETFINGNLRLITGERATLVLNMNLKGQTYSCTAEGDMVEQASNKPLTEETVRDKVGKTGNTRYSFESLQIDISNDAFYSLKALKDLRRNAIAALESCILNSSRRELNNSRIESAEEDDDRTNMLSNKIESGQMNVDKSDVSLRENDTRSLNFCNNISVMVSGVEQYQIAVEYPWVDFIYLDMQYFDKTCLMKLLLQAKDLPDKQKLSVVLPPILRFRYLKEVESVITYIQTEELDVGLVVRNLDELAIVKKIGYTGRITTDYSVYAMNDWAAACIRDIYPQAKLTIPVELNEQQMQRLQFVGDNSEMVIYGYQQLMVSAQCLQNTVDKCNRSGIHFVMRDRYLKNFYVSSICKYCYNLIYNGIPTIVYDLVDKSFNGNMVKRIHFTRENEMEVRNVMEAFVSGTLPAIEKTRGHYKRGVE